MKSDNRYEVAFAAYLRAKGVGFIAVDEARRTLFNGVDVKSLDFIIVGPHDARLVVDVKGRKFPGGSAEKPRRVWQNWASEEDVLGLGHWAKVLGPGYRGVLAFVYRIEPPFAVPDATPDQFTFRDEQYLMRAVDAASYRERMRVRSPKWGTVGLGTADFRTLVKPFSTFLQPSLVAAL